MKKHLIICLLFFSINTAFSQKCPENITVDRLLEFPEFLDSHRPKLKTLRDWARKNNKPKVELVTNRLEYWAKDMARYIRKYAKTNTQKVCERLTVTDRKYLDDFVILTLPTYDFIYTTEQRVSKVNLNKYK